MSHEERRGEAADSRHDDQERHLRLSEEAYDVLPAEAVLPPHP